MNKKLLLWIVIPVVTILVLLGLGVLKIVALVNSEAAKFNYDGDNVTMAGTLEMIEVPECGGKSMKYLRYGTKPLVFVRGVSDDTLMGEKVIVNGMMNVPDCDLAVNKSCICEYYLDVKSLRVDG